MVGLRVVGLESETVTEVLSIAPSREREGERERERERESEDALLCVIARVSALYVC